MVMKEDAKLQEMIEEIRKGVRERLAQANMARLARIKGAKVTAPSSGSDQAEK
jgi:hypothetical protein